MSADATSLGRVILAGIVGSGRPELLDEALGQLTPEHFVDNHQRVLFSLLERYLEVGRAVMPRNFLEGLLRGQDPAKIMLMRELYDSLAVSPVPEDQFRVAITLIRELAAERATAEALTTGMDILRNGQTDRRGNVQQGHLDARTAVLTRFAEIEREFLMHEAPEGNMRNEANELLADYQVQQERRLAGHLRGVTFGIPEVDSRTGGMSPGELVLIGGFSSDGKSTVCAQGAWSAAVEQGKNVVIMTTETVRAQFRRKLVARHSKLPYWGLPDGINTTDLKNGTLRPEHTPVLQAIINDLTGNPNYGALYIAQVPRGATVASCEARMYRIQRQFNIDVVYFDYLALLRADVRRDSDRESLGSIIKEAKQVATTFDHGRGIPLISPWQVNRKAKEYADAHGMYLSEHMAETAEATNSADLLVSILSNENRDARVRDVRMQILKNRDGETALMSPLTVRVDYGTCAFSIAGEAQVARTLDQMIQPQTTLGSMQ